jgi:hypothetical protein
MEAPSFDASSFGVDDPPIVTVLADVTREDGTRLIAGLASSDWNNELVLAALDMLGTRLVPRLLARSPNSYGNRGCRAEVSTELVPDGESIVAACLTGGTNGLGYVSVLGVDPNGSGPRVLLELSCSVTNFVLDGSALRILSEGEKPGANIPGGEQPDQMLAWDGFGLSAQDPESFDRYCTPGVDRYEGPAA